MESLKYLAMDEDKFISQAKVEVEMRQSAIEELRQYKANHDELVENGFPNPEGQPLFKGTLSTQKQLNQAPKNETPPLHDEAYDLPCLNDALGPDDTVMNDDYHVTKK